MSPSEIIIILLDSLFSLYFISSLSAIREVNLFLNTDSNSPSNKTATGTFLRLYCSCCGSNLTMSRLTRVGAFTNLVYGDVSNKTVFLISGFPTKSIELTNFPLIASNPLAIGCLFCCKNNGKKFQGKRSVLV